METQRGGFKKVFPFAGYKFPSYELPFFNVQNLPHIHQICEMPKQLTKLIEFF